MLVLFPVVARIFILGTATAPDIHPFYTKGFIPTIARGISTGLAITGLAIT